MSDGSTDGSEASIADIDGVRVITQPRNMGKGRHCIMVFTGQGQYLGMVDADGDIDPTYLCDYLQRAKAHNLEASCTPEAPRRFAVRSQFAAQGRLAGLRHLRDRAVRPRRHRHADRLQAVPA